MSDEKRGPGNVVEEHSPGPRIPPCSWHMVHEREPRLWQGERPRAERMERVRELAGHLPGPPRTVVPSSL